MVLASVGCGFAGRVPRVACPPVFLKHWLQAASGTLLPTGGGMVWRSQAMIRPDTGPYCRTARMGGGIAVDPAAERS